MKRENWEKVKQIFNDALEIAPSERETFLDKICGDDEDLRRETEVLLKSFEDDFLETPAVEQVADVIAEEQNPLKTEAEPLFSLLREPKRIVIVESGHVPPPEIFAPTINNWLDETLGKIGNE
ncbi:hypothetical protein BH10ACI1_BH10ACI1_15290 [soil metagenome]